MLAVYPRMASRSPSRPFPANGANLLRQPSAEDIDAAHQLISSARGERMGTQLTRDTHRTNTPTEHPSPSTATFSEEGVEQASAQIVDEAQQLGQVCR